MIDVAAWGWPQFTGLFITSLSLGLSISKHGQPRDPHNIFMDLIGLALSYTILICGGFFA